MPAPKAPGSLWICDPFFDLLFFIFPTICSTALILALVYSDPSATLFAFLNATVLMVNFSHGWGTIFFYADRQNLRRYKSQYGKYFIFPAAILITCIALATTSAAPLIILLGYIFLNHHTTRQNVGFLGFYRHKLGIANPVDKAIDNQLIYSTVTLMYATGWIYGTAKSVAAEGVTAKILNGFVTVGKVAIPLLIVWTCVAVAKALYARSRTFVQFRGRALPYFGMLLTSISFAIPPAIAIALPGNFEKAQKFILYGSLTFGVFAHNVQYLALLFLINRNKYPAAPNSHADMLGDDADHSPLLIVSKMGWAGKDIFMFFCVLFGLLFTLLSVNFKNVPIYGPYVLAGLTGFGFVHFWLDHLIWAFKHEENRKAILPYIKPMSSR